LGNDARTGTKAMRRFYDMFKDERGATAVEYGLILALIFLAMVGAVGTFAETTIDMWDNVANKVQGS
jgi:pilus assembly protein Flp/PilA